MLLLLFVTYLFTSKRCYAMNRLTSLLNRIICGDASPHECVTFNKHFNCIRKNEINWNDVVNEAAHSSSKVKDVVTEYFTNHSDVFATAHVICLCVFLCDVCNLMIKNGVSLDVCDLVQHLVYSMIDRDVEVCLKYLNCFGKIND